MRLRTVVVAIVVTATLGSGATTRAATDLACTHTPSTRRADVSPIGPLRWTKYGPEWPLSMSVDGDLVVALGLAGDVGAWDATTGDARWGRRLGAPSESRPEISTNVVMIPAGHTLSALDRDTGEVVWEKRVVPTPQLALLRTPDRELLFTAETNSRYTAIDVATGSTVWQVELRDPLQSATTIDASANVAVASMIGPKLGRWYVVLDARSGHELWRVHARAHSPSPVLVNGLVIVPKTGPHAHVVAYDEMTGAVRWRATLDGSLVETLVPTGDSRHAVFLDRCGTMTLLDSTTGERVWTASVGEPPEATYLRLTPADAVLSSGHEIVAVDRTTGVVRSTEGSKLVMHDLLPAGDAVAVLLDFDLTGVVAVFDRGTLSSPPLH